MIFKSILKSFITVVVIYIYQEIWYLTSGKRQSIPSAVFPLIPIGMNFFHLGNSFFVTSPIAFYTFKGSLFLESAP